MGMTDVSNEYLSRMISESGLKLKSSTAKHQEMIAIIELLDENSLGGLLKSIREDYNRAVKMAERLDVLSARRFDYEY